MVWKVYAIVVVIAAVIFAGLFVSLPMERLHDLLHFQRFFETMIYVLVVGALIKYLFCCRK